MWLKTWTSSLSNRARSMMKRDSVVSIKLARPLKWPFVRNPIVPCDPSNSWLLAWEPQAAE